MKYSCFLSKISVLAVCAMFLFVSCEEKLEMAISGFFVEFDALPEDTVFISVTGNVNWIVEIIQTEQWLTVEPMEGNGNETLTILAEDNSDFTSRSAKIAISGEGVQTDTIRIEQLADVDISIHIRDIVFKEYCFESFDDNKDGKISMKEARAAREIHVRRRQIYTLAGIEHFTRITLLDCSNNFIEELNLSHNVMLKELNCTNNYIETLDLRNNKELEILQCPYNPIISLNLSGLDKLKKIDAYSASLYSIDVSTNTALTELLLSNNEIQILDLSNNPELLDLWCSANLLTTLDLTNNPKLEVLYCDNNRLSTINLSANTKLMHLWCEFNQFSGGTIDVSNNVDLITFRCSNNNLTSLNLVNNTRLQQLICSSNLLTSLNLSSNTELTHVNCANNRLSGSINISNNRKLIESHFGGNPELGSIYVWADFLIIAENNELRYSKDPEAEWVVTD